MYRVYICVIPMSLFCCDLIMRSLPVHHRGEETDLGTSRSLTRLPFVPRNTVGRGRTEPRIIDSRSVFYILCSLLLDICIRYVLAGYWLFVMCSLLGVPCSPLVASCYMKTVLRCVFIVICYLLLVVVNIAVTGY